MSEQKRRTETKEINGKSYRVQVLCSKEARDGLIRLQRVLGPLMSLLLTGANRAELVGRMANHLSEKLNPEDLDWFCANVGKNTAVSWTDDSGEARDIPSLARLESQDEVFAGAILDLFKWLEFAMEVNYGDFLALIRSAAAKGLATQEAKAESVSRSRTR